MAASVEVRIELGHRAKIRDVATEKGHTHDWMVYVKGFEGISLGYFVEKVVFHLHETYDQAKRVVKQPPYRVEESGFAGFIMPIDVYFRNREEPKTVTFNYDLFLHVDSMPPVNHTRLEKLTFTNPTEDFRKKLLEAGALLIRPNRHSSKERSRESPSAHSKKERSKTKEHSKRREGSSHHEDRKKPAAISSKKEGRIAGKDIKRHEDEFKHPKMPDVPKASKEASRDSTHRERGRSEKKRPRPESEGGKKKKKKHVSPSPQQESRPKSLNVPSTSSSKKEKVRKIKEKPDVMAGLFAPENSINMSHIKQSREKRKTESNTEPRVKKEKRTIVATPAGSSDSPRLDDQTRTSKSSSSGNLMVKIKKEKSSPSLDKDVKKEISSKKRPEKIKTEKKEEFASKHKKRIKEKLDVAKAEYQERPRRSPIISSSSSGSDMEISASSDSSPERPPKPSKSSHKVSKTEKKSHKTSKSHKESISNIEKSSKKISSQGISKNDKRKVEKSRGESPGILSRSKDRSKISESPQSQGSSKLTKKTDKKESKLAESCEKGTSGQISRKSKKEKHSSREKEDKAHKDSKRSKVLIKEEKPGSISTPDRSKTKSPKLQKTTLPFATVKPNVASISPSPHVRQKHTHQRPSDQKLKSSENVIAKMPAIVKSETSKSRKEHPFSDTDSSDDSDLPADLFTTNIPPHHSPIDGEPSRSRSPSVSSSSSSSAVSSMSEHMPSHSSSSPSSADSSDEEELQKIHETAAITEPALSPIDSVYNSYQPAQMSTSDDSSSPVRDNGSQPSQTESVMQNAISNESNIARVSPMPHVSVRDHDLYTTSDEDEEFVLQPPERPFQDSEDDAAFEDDPPPETIHSIMVKSGDNQNYPHMTRELFHELQDLQKKLSIITDVRRLHKIAKIVHGSRNLLHNDGYFNFDLCALDKRTIRKIKKELKAA